MTDYLTAARLLLAQNVKLYADIDTGASGAPAKSHADDYLAAMTVLDWSIVHPMNRSNHGRKVDYGFAAPDILISAVLSGTSELLPKLVDLCSQNEVGVIESRVWRFEVQDLASSTADKKTEGWADVIVYELRGSKVDAHPGQPVTVEVTMIVRDPTANDFEALNVATADV